MRRCCKEPPRKMAVSLFRGEVSKVRNNIPRNRVIA